MKYFAFTSFFILLLSCERKDTVYISDKNNMVLLVNDSIIEGYTIHPLYNKYTCHIFFKGRKKQSKEKYHIADIYRREGDKLFNINDSGYFLYKLENGKLLVQYKTNNIGCSDWIFPNSNETNTVDTFNLKILGRYENPKISLIKKKVAETDFVITYLNKKQNVNAINPYWDQNTCKIKEFSIKKNDVLIISK